ncbi:MMPL family transporter [Corynebacterium freiburgense]|uniref:MMPL family transporter n=1 Tax=Corynebacterium freiburgense TaxID=556548 RepID=UPI0003F5CD62|nr:MMPL family transporter [Corynebacterium freiburgense]WJZ01415.1 Membrane protein YdfJ [Corynebacterium freiburgense]
MAKLLFRIGRFSYRRKWAVLAIWAVIFAAISGSASAFQRGFDDVFSIPGTPSQRAAESLVELFPDQKNPLESAGVNMVFAAPEGHRLDEPKYSQAIDVVIGRIEKDLPGLTDTRRFGNPVKLSPELMQGIIEQETQSGLPLPMAEKDAYNLRLVSDDGRIGYTTFGIDVPLPSAVTEEHRKVINDAMQAGRDLGLTVESGGAAFGDPLVIKSTSEIIGIGVAFLVLLFTFGSLIAAGLPLVTAVVGVGIGSASIILATAWAPLNNTTPVLAVMLGLAVGIDYALFIVSRFRSEYKRAPRDEAAGMAVGTAGSAVVFAGLTVVIALVALTIVNIPFLTYMGLAAAFTVSVAVLVALTLLPALLGVAGQYAFGLRIPKIGKESDEKGTFTRSKGRVWVGFVHRFPALVLTVVVLGLGALTIPATRLELALPSDTTSNLDTTQRKSADLMKEGFGPGVNAPFLLVVDAREVDAQSQVLAPLVGVMKDEAERNEQEFKRKDAAALASFQHTIQQFATHPGVKHAQIIGVNEKNNAAQMLLTPNYGPEDPMTSQLMAALRSREQTIESSTGIEIGITGLTPIQRDVTQKLSDAMPIYLGIVVGLAVLLLLVVFRSVMVPVVAGLGFLLSVGAAFGVTVLFWQEGLWGMVNTPGPLISFMPIFLIGVTFGLAMDYQVFLVSRMREHYTHIAGKPQSGKYNIVEESIIEGYTLGSRVVTSAALIMIAVFVAFIDQPLPFIKIFGFALGAGVFFDAFFVRMGLVPAAMFLLGRATWWIPAWLDRILPVVDVEGAALESEWVRLQEERDRQNTEKLHALRQG